MRWANSWRQEGTRYIHFLCINYVYLTFQNLVIDKDIIHKAVKLHQQQVKLNELDTRFKYSKFRDFGLKRIISLNDSSENESEEENRQKYYKSVEQRLKVRPKYSHRGKNKYKHPQL